MLRVRLIIDNRVKGLQMRHIQNRDELRDWQRELQAQGYLTVIDWNFAGEYIAAQNGTAVIIKRKY